MLNSELVCSLESLGVCLAKMEVASTNDTATVPTLIDKTHDYCIVEQDDSASTLVTISLSTL